MDFPERAAAILAKVTILIGVGTAGASWVDNISPGVWIGILTGLLSILVQTFFRFLADRRDHRQKRLEEELRKIEHEVFRNRYSQPPTRPAPLEK